MSKRGGKNKKKKKDQGAGRGRGPRSRSYRPPLKFYPLLAARRQDEIRGKGGKKQESRLARRDGMSLRHPSISLRLLPSPSEKGKEKGKKRHAKKVIVDTQQSRAAIEGRGRKVSRGKGK